MNTKRLETKNVLWASVIFIGFVVIVVIPEILVFGFDQEARDDWTRMLPAAVFAPFVWGMGIFALVAGVYMLYELFRDKNMDLLPGSLAFIHPGVHIPYYWIKRIVIDDIPAFGYDPDNIYAVAGMDTIGLGMVWALEGMIVGLLLYGLIWGFRRLLKGG